MKFIYKSLDETYGLDYNETNFHETKKIYREEGYQMNSFSSIENTYVYQSMADKNILDAWSKCNGGDYSLSGSVTKKDANIYELQLSTIGVNNSIKIKDSKFTNIECLSSVPEIINTGDIIKIPLMISDNKKTSIIYIYGENKIGNTVSYTMYIPIIPLPPAIDKQKLLLRRAFKIEKQNVFLDGSSGCCLAYANDSIVPKKLVISSSKNGFSYDLIIKRWRGWGNCCGTEYDDYTIFNWTCSVSGSYRIQNNKILLNKESIRINSGVPSNQTTNCIETIRSFILSRDGLYLE